MTEFTKRREHHLEACEIHGRVPYVDRTIDTMRKIHGRGPYVGRSIDTMRKPSIQLKRYDAGYCLDAPETIPEPGISLGFANVFLREWLCENPTKGSDSDAV